MNHMPDLTVYRGTGAWTRRQVLTAGGAVAVTLLAGCRPAEPSPAPAPTTPPVSLPTPTPAAEARPLEIAPDLRRKLAQMVLVGFRGTVIEADNPIVADIRDRGIGGVVLFSYDVALQSPVRNVESPAQVAALDAALAELAADPLMIAVDQEGGKVARFNETHGFPPTVSAQALGEQNDPDATYAAAAQLAETLKAAGVRHNFAPVVDVNTNPDNPVIAAYERSFSADPEKVTAHAAAFIEAHHAHGVLCTLKHFPGHGSSRDDSHRGFVDVSATWSPVELEPYAALMDAGLADSVMTAHVFNRAWDATDPATLAPGAIQGLLRDELGYDGVVISDDMQMDAIADNYGFAEAVVGTVAAGVDVVVVGNNLAYEPDVAARIIDLLAAAVADGRLSEARIDESYRRIMALKAKWAGQG
ncbi:MAG: glycoside hydrolase family 3 [Caldilinea sp.]|nr:glycoside hydrolase family 3 [Caldilinea sp.]